MNEFTLIQIEKKRLLDETLQLKREIYSKYPVGGALHIVLDDGNLNDHHIKSCLGDIAKLTNEDDKNMFLDCAHNLLAMSMRQRIKVYKSR